MSKREEETWPAGIPSPPASGSDCPADHWAHTTPALPGMLGGTARTTHLLRFLKGL